MKSTSVAFAILSLCCLSHAGQLTSVQVLKKSQLAYDSVTTFEQDATGTITGQTGTAHFSFKRPGQLRVTGKSLFGSPYGLLVLGKSTEVLNVNRWKTEPSPQIGIAAITGISASAGTNLSSILLKTSQNLLTVLANSSPTVKLETLEGRPTYHLSTDAVSNIDLWIDAKTFFVVKTSTKAGPYSIAVKYGPPKVNQPIPASRFVK
jgi:outer membrane lipoprotein-sorting protein